jgi:hypothetical protein
MHFHIILNVVQNTYTGKKQQQTTKQNNNNKKEP